MGAFGSSHGGGLALACASRYPEISRVAVAYPFLSDYKRVWLVDGGGIACAEIREFFRKFDISSGRVMAPLTSTQNAPLSKHSRAC